MYFGYSNVSDIKIGKIKVIINVCNQLYMN